MLMGNGTVTSTLPSVVPTNQSILLIWIAGPAISVIPAGFQYSAEGSLAMATKAPPMA